jgi:DNA-binding NtrC family response regulator
MRRAALLASGAIEPEHLSFTFTDSATPAFTPEPIPVGSSLKAIGEVALANAEQHAIRRALEAAKGNKSKAARQLRTDYRTLHRKMKQYGIGPGSFRVFEHS